LCPCYHSQIKLQIGGDSIQFTIVCELDVMNMAIITVGNISPPSAKCGGDGGLQTGSKDLSVLVYTFVCHVILVL
jgi:hypothetical protein